MVQLAIQIAAGLLLLFCGIGVLYGVKVLVEHLAGEVDWGKIGAGALLVVICVGAVYLGAISR